MGNAVLFLNSYDIVSDKSVDRVCNANHRIGALNEKVVDFCEEKAESNRIENVVDIKRLADVVAEVDEVKDDVVEEEEKQSNEEENVNVESIGIVKDARIVRAAIKSHLNEKGRID